MLASKAFIPVGQIRTSVQVGRNEWNVHTSTSTDWRRALIKFVETVSAREKESVCLSFFSEHQDCIIIWYKQGGAFTRSVASWPLEDDEGLPQEGDKGLIWLLIEEGKALTDGAVEGAMLRFMRDKSITTLALDYKFSEWPRTTVYLRKTEGNQIALAIS